MEELTNLERETQILFNEAEPDAEVFTANARMKRRLREISEADPQSCALLSTDSWGFEKWKISKELISLRKPMSEEARKARSERAKKGNYIEVVGRSKK